MSAASLTRSFAKLRLPSSSLTQCLPVLPRARVVAQRLPPTILSSRSYASEASSSIRLGNLRPGQPTKTRKRVGRGSGSGRGGTSGRGHNGQKSRAGNGKPVPGFEGGQTPFTRLFPKRGFINPHRQTFIPINLDKIQHWIDRGLLDPSKPITIKELFDSRCIHGLKDGVKILGDGAGHLNTPINLIVSKASQSAIAAVEKLGGSVECRYYTMLTLRALVKPEKFHGKLMPRAADPINQRELVWYSSPRNRGYLAKRYAFKQMMAATMGTSVESDVVVDTETGTTAQAEGSTTA